VEVARAPALFNCATCTWGRHCDESNPAPTPQFVITGAVDLESRTCFLPMITPQSRFLLRLHSHYRNRWLPYAGGLFEQPNYYLEAMELINGVLDRGDGRKQN
jgi:hypothetical protein